MISEPSLRYVANLLGWPFLAYVTDLPEHAVRYRIEGSDDSLAEPHESVLQQTLAVALSWVPFPPSAESVLPPDGNRPDGTANDRMQRFGWVDMDREHSYANLGRMASNGVVATPPPGLDAVEESLALAAIDFYPVTLIPPFELGQPFTGYPVISHARCTRFEDAALQDSSIRSILTAEATIWTSSSGLGFPPPTPARLICCIVASAQQQVTLLDQRGVDAFVAATLAKLNTAVVGSPATRGGA